MSKPMSASVWHRLQAQLQGSLPPEEFRTWFGPLAVESESESRLILRAPNQRFVSSLEEVYRPMVDRAVADLQGASYEVLFSSAGGRAAAAPAADAPFESRYQFDTFVVGNSNQFAHAAARAVAEKPGHSYNPLFLYGGVGLGKTHLLHAIGHHIRRTPPAGCSVHVPDRRAVRQRADQLDPLRPHAELPRALPLDRRAAGRRRPVPRQQGADAGGVLPHLQHALHERRSRSSSPRDSSPRDIPTLEERLRSRFEWGLIADIQPPDLETKVAILRRKAEVEGRRAARRRRDLHRPPGALQRPRARGAAQPRPGLLLAHRRAARIELAKETLKDILPDRTAARQAPPRSSSTWRATTASRCSRSRARPTRSQIAFPRQVAMYLCKKLTDLSFPEIGTAVQRQAPLDGHVLGREDRAAAPAGRRPRPHAPGHDRPLRVSVRSRRHPSLARSLPAAGLRTRAAEAAADDLPRAADSPHPPAALPSSAHPRRSSTAVRSSDARRPAAREAVLDSFRILHRHLQTTATSIDIIGIFVGGVERMEIRLNRAEFLTELVPDAGHRRAARRRFRCSRTSC